MRVWWEEDYWQQYNKGIEDDVLLVAKQWMVYAHLRCPKPPVRVARGLLQSTIRIENQFHLGMDQVVGYVGNERTPYTIYTIERWISPRWKGKKNPNERWFYDAINDVSGLASEKGVHIDG